MKKVFKDVLNQLIILNDFVGKKALTESDLKEERENYDNFLQTMKEMEELLIVFKNTPINDIRAGSKNIKRLHLLMDKLSWYMENLHERVRTVFKHYPVPDDL